MMKNNHKDADVDLLVQSHSIADLQQMLLATKPLYPPDSQSAKDEQLRQLLLDPVWQLK